MCEREMARRNEISERQREGGRQEERECDLTREGGRSKGRGKERDKDNQ